MKSSLQGCLNFICLLQNKFGRRLIGFGLITVLENNLISKGEEKNEAEVEKEEEEMF